MSRAVPVNERKKNVKISIRSQVSYRTSERDRTGGDTYGPLFLVLGGHMVVEVGNRAESKDAVLEDELHGGVQERALWWR